ncbi:MAG TPA: hypothetical protein DD727_00865, partial [Clostridiales bacterium]|nr:hypothetical protein [Clostridiales bacterium]
MIRMLSGIMEHKSQVVVFPELCITGYTCGDLFYQNRLLDAAHEAYRRLL